MQTMRSIVESPVGSWTVEGTDDLVSAIRFDAKPVKTKPGARPKGAVLEATLQLKRYFAHGAFGERLLEDVPLQPEGTDFQQTVWRALLEIPHGQTWSYGQLAKHIGKPKASRAVGAANGKTPSPFSSPATA